MGNENTAPLKISRAGFCNSLFLLSVRAGSFRIRLSFQRGQLADPFYWGLTAFMAIQIYLPNLLSPSYLSCVLCGGSWDSGSRHHARDWGEELRTDVPPSSDLSGDRRDEKIPSEMNGAIHTSQSVVSGYIYVLNNIHPHLEFSLSSGHLTVMNRSFQTFLKTLLLKGHFFLSAI